MKIRGSQTRETLEESGYRVIERKGNDIILADAADNLELWHKNDHYSGYVVEIDGIGYEFVTGDILQ